MAAILLLAWFLPVSLERTAVLLVAIPVVWAGALAILTFWLYRRPPVSEVAKRADRVLGLPDDLLALSEFPDSESGRAWRAAAWRQAEKTFASGMPRWPLAFPERYSWNIVVAVVLTFGAFGLAWKQRQQESMRLAEAAEARADRINSAGDILKDWEEFAKETPDPSLKKLFAEAAVLREAVRSTDPMAAMLAMNKIEAKMASLQETIAAQSLSPQAEHIAEALESFEGMGAMSAALRNKNFESAAKEAEKLVQKLAKDPESSTALRRGEAVADILASEAAAAQKRGNGSLSDPLTKLASAASQNCKNGSIPNKQISPCMNSLKDAFSKESACKSCGRMVSIGKSQMETLRCKLRGEPCEAPPSLCKNGSCSKPGSKPGGSKAGTGTDGQPLADQTNLAEAGQSEQVTGVLGEGETEKITLSASSGTPGAASEGCKTKLAEYLELSEKAVADESLPLAHRRAIRNYFERIRPVAELKNP